MKKLVLLSFVMLLIASLHAQPGAVKEPPYKRFPSLPPFKLLLTDSATIFTREDLSDKMPVMIMLFSPDCDHCRQETEEIIRHKKEFEKVQIIMATTFPFDKMLAFYNKYDLKRFSNIKVGKEVNFMFPVYYDIRNFPFFAFYNRKKKLISVSEGSLPVEKILVALKN